MTWQRVLSPYLILLLLLSACTTPDETPAVTEPTPTVIPATGAPVAPQNLFITILGPAPAPAGWLVEPCEGEAAALCVRINGDTVGIVELLTFSLESQMIFQAIVAEHGLAFDAIDVESETYQATAGPVLQALAADHLTRVHVERELTYGENVRFVPLEMEPVPVGELPGLAFGFTTLAEDGQVLERYLSYAAFDEDVIYWISAAFDPNNVSTFATDEALQQFTPYLQQIVAGLRLPLAEQDPLP